MKVYHSFFLSMVYDWNNNNGLKDCIKMYI